MTYPSDRADEAWAVIAPHLTQKARTGRPRTVDMRRVFNAIPYKNRTGRQWDTLPEGFPPKSTVFDYFQKWNEDGTFIRINDRLRERVRAAMGRDQHPSISIVESQSVKTTEAGGDSGYNTEKIARVASGTALLTRTDVCCASSSTPQTVPRARAASGSCVSIAHHERALRPFVLTKATSTCASHRSTRSRQVLWK